MIRNICISFSPVLAVLAGLILALCFSAVPAMASDVRVSGSVSSRNIAVGQQFTFTVEIQSREPRNIKSPELPELEGMRYLTTVPRTSSSYSLVNGVAQMTYRFSYVLEAVETGSWHVPSAYVSIDGREYQTRPVTVIIREEGDIATQRGTRARPERPEIYLELELSENRPVRGQQIIAEIVLYFRNTIEVSTFHVTQGWQTEGFWLEDLNQSPTRRPESVILDGKSYSRAVLSRYALFPARSGELSVPPFSIRASIRQSGRFQDNFSSFFQGFGRQRNIDLQTSPKTVRVQPPPRPPDDGKLISALGQFTIERKLSQNTVKLGEAVDVITEVRGSGNLGLITRPHFEYPASFDTHRPRETIERDERAPIVTGSKQFRDVLIARSAGTFTLPQDLVYIYDDIRRRYEPHFLPELIIEVVRDPNAKVTLALNQDVRLTPIRGSVKWTTLESRPIYFAWWFWFALVIPLGLFTAGYRARRYQLKLDGDRSFCRREQAYDNAMALLSSTGTITGTKPMYTVIYKAASNFITDQLDLPAAGLSEKQIADELRKRNVEAPLANRVQQLLQKCSEIRYAPDPSARDLLSDLNEARRLISELRPQL